ncbi:amidohydrolase family protein [Streptomyces sp. NPDC005438]|uniref:amidohydrolase family protein n=1 Tax=Streptomyces sp. NPDC005438 TaxID=3156880 RepID=UPI0033B4F2EC
MHSHHFDIGPEAPEGDPHAPRLVRDDAANGRVLCGSSLFRRVRAPLWDVEARLREMDAAGVSHQVISPVPVVMEHAGRTADPGFARTVNSSLAAACQRSGGRLLGLGCLPALPGEEALATVEECRALGLRGVEVGTTVSGLDLDDPRLRPLWRECERTDSAVFVHPVDGGRKVVRRPGGPYDLGLGMTTDTALAATALVFGGVLREHPRLRVALAHGGGTFAAAYPRLRTAAALHGGAPEEHDALVRRLWVDSLVFDEELLGPLQHRFGPDRLLLGSDEPFFPDQLRRSRRDLVSATGRGLLSGDPLVANALEFLGLPVPPAAPGPGVPAPRARPSGAL